MANFKISDPEFANMQKDELYANYNQINDDVETITKTLESIKFKQLKYDKCVKYYRTIEIDKAFDEYVDKLYNIFQGKNLIRDYENVCNKHILMDKLNDKINGTCRSLR